MYNKNFSKEPTERQNIGQIGEECACDYLESIGHKIVERNYLKKWGELDIVAKLGKILHIVEVKTVSRDLSSDVIHETSDDYRPEDNMHPWKLKRLSRAIQSYLLDRNISDDIEWQFDVVTIYLDQNKGQYMVEILEDVVL